MSTNQKTKRRYRKYSKKYFSGPQGIHAKCPNDYPTKLSVTRKVRGQNKRVRRKGIPSVAGVYCSQRPRRLSRDAWKRALKEARQQGKESFRYNGNLYKRDGIGKLYYNANLSSKQREKRRLSAKKSRDKRKRQARVKASAVHRAKLGAGRRRSRHHVRRSRSRSRRYRY